MKRRLILFTYFIFMLIKYSKYIKYAIVSLSLFSLFIFFEPRVYKEFWEYSWNLLLLILFIRPFRDIFPKCRLFSFIMIFRRELWILAWILAIMHWLWSFLEKEGFSILFDKSTWSFSSYLFWWMISWIVSLPLLLTSNNFSLKTLWFKNWKLIQRLAYLMFLFAAIHIALIENWEKAVAISIIVITYIIIYILAEIFKNKKTPN